MFQISISSKLRTGLCPACPAGADGTLARIRAWRQICPEITIRSTFIVGFPGETEDDFRQLLDFLEQAQLDRVGCFTYSPVEGAKANELPDAVPEEVKQERFMDMQERISADKLADKVGRTMTVLVDDVQQDGVVVARSSADAPEIDGLVYLENADGVEVGEFVDIKVTRADAHDLWGEVEH